MTNYRDITMQALKVSILSLGISVLGFSPAFAEHGTAPDYYAPQEPEKVYVESGDRSFQTTRDEECFYNEAHGHLHCYAEDTQPVRQVTYIETPRSRTYRTVHTTYRDDYRRPISTGIAIGLGIGIPILLHNSFSHHGGHHYRGHHGRRH
jgi:hypothetical protein